MSTLPLPSSRSQPESAASLSATAVHRLMSRDIQLPLAALRASLESIARAGSSGERQSLVTNALAQLDRVEMAAELLCEHANPRAPKAGPCTVEEIARSAMRALRPSERARVCLALEEPRAEVEVDAPLLARSLTRILQGALTDGAQELLFHSHAGPDRLTVSIVDDLDPARHSDLELSFEPSSEHVRRAEVAIAVRDVRRIGGCVSFLRVGAGRTCVLVEVPLRAEGGQPL